MGEPCRPWWNNCVLESDPETEAIDRIEDELGPLDPGVARVRGLIGTLELCHHKAARWIDNVVAAIAAGDSAKGLGTRPSGERHEAEEGWQRVADELSTWCDAASGPASPLLAPLGERTPLKAWQVQRVAEKIRSSIGWPNPVEEYTWLLLGGDEHDCWYRSDCPPLHRDNEESWRATVETLIADTVDGESAQLSLALAIDMLMPCHWRFEENVQLVLAAIGGDLDPAEPFAACGRNLGMLPDRPQLELMCAGLRAYGGTAESGTAGANLRASLGEPTPERRWLAASLEKTIRLQLDPPADVAEMSSLSGPAWLGGSP